jgi:hypothetical protein
LIDYDCYLLFAIEEGRKNKEWAKNNHADKKMAVVNKGLLKYKDQFQKNW